MKEEEIWFVRIDEKNDNIHLTEEIYKNHLQYLTQITSEIKLIGGGFQNVPGGMILFQTANLNEARKISESDPLIVTKAYKYKLYEWKLKIVSNKANC
ncbi:hypothetical protein NEF87_004639 [Candidatus Lokiarchaeum ossiferum]|uniref:YCII-related domain-containing protein n=1 Tax=Candidatus Lokiarchaeum ossiferum TaxID=2951803 RepID=A0ABY6HXU6_9ARCH|nr:hypothetical protein NEF87_004639 [Candidatus Lokiarchaeum sp. B-35]